MNSESVAVAIRDALDTTTLDEDESIIEVVDDFSNLWIKTSEGQTFLVKISRIEP